MFRELAPHIEQLRMDMAVLGYARMSALADGDHEFLRDTEEQKRIMNATMDYFMEYEFAGLMFKHRQWLTSQRDKTRFMFTEPETED